MEDILTTMVVLVPSVLSLCVSGIYAYIALRKAKEPPKDEVWETATKMICADNSGTKDADEFAELYEQLKFFKENGCSFAGYNSLFTAVEDKKRLVRTQSEAGSKSQS